MKQHTSRLLLAAAGLVALVTIARSTPVLFWELADRTQDGQMTMFNPSAGDGDTGIPVYGGGDLDGDGKMDAILSAITGDGRLGDRTSCGELHVLFGVDSIRGLVDFANYDGVYSNLLTIWGRSRKDYFSSNAKTGDLDGDGTQDLIVGAMWADTLGRQDCGSVYIIWGGAHLRDRFIDLASSADMTEFEITTITGAQADDKLGVWISTGDADNDGAIDVLIGAPRADGYQNARQQSGEVYLLFGPFARLDHIDLANTTHRRTIIYGIDADDQMGNTVELDDINGDVYDDLILGAGAYRVARLGDTNVDYPFETGGAGDGPLNNRPEAGEFYILPGRAIWPDTIDLHAGMPTGSTVVWGAYGNSGPEIGGDELAEEIVTADINGDGIHDLIVGAFRADGYYNDIFWAGNCYVFYGRYNWFSSWDLQSGLPDSTSIIWGGGEDWLVGDSNPCGDLNGDGYFDIFAAAVHDGGPYNIYKSGCVRVVYGGPQLLPQLIDLASPPLSIGKVPAIQGAEESDLLAYWCTTGDFNGDGYWDIIPNVMHGDGPNNERNNGGDFHILSGEWFTRHPGKPRYFTALPLVDRVQLEWFDNGEAGTDHHVVFRRLDSVSTFDSIATVPYPGHLFLDTTVTNPNTYVYRITAVSAAGFPSNPSDPVAATLGLNVGSDVPLVVNGIHWTFYGSEAYNFWNDDVLMGADTFDFWDLYSTGTYPPGLIPRGFGPDSLPAAILNSRRVIWVLNGYDPADPDTNDGTILRGFGNVLDAYLQNGGELLVIGKELNDFMPPTTLRDYAHVVGSGFDNSVTTTNALVALHPGLSDIAKRAGGANADNLAPLRIDVSGCTLPLYKFDNVVPQELMGILSRAAPPNFYNTCLISHRPYRADQTPLRQSLDYIYDNLLGRYPAPTGLTAQAADTQIVLNWVLPTSFSYTGMRVFRRRADGQGPVDTLAVVNTPGIAYADATHNRYETYDYWICSVHGDGRTSLPSDTVQGFAPGAPSVGDMLIVNGMDWTVYGAEITPFYTDNVIQGTRPFRFWDLFTTGSYPPGYTPDGHGTDSLMAAIWQSRQTVWLFNNFGGDQAAFTAMLPVLNLYLDSGGNLLIMGKELSTSLGAELESRLQLTSWLTAVDWLNTDTARSEHPALLDFGKLNASQMSLCPEFTLAGSPLVQPLYHRNFNAAAVIGAAARPTPTAAYNLIMLSIRPYRVIGAQLRSAMETLLTGFWDHTLVDPVEHLTAARSGGAVEIRWSARVGATGYRVCRLSDWNDLVSSSTIIGTTGSTSFLDTAPLGSGDQRRYYLVYPILP
ncbi:FG-GAP repeat protein [candidate division KSB1 bacterium]|nr:FG-GAP repeat protein [candidate division KSB1 bacterium]